MKIPRELSNYFDENNFSNYPLVTIPQEFEDHRGQIRNLADGIIGDVAIISSYKGAIRANHVHRNDWHLCYLMEGSLEYFWTDEKKRKKRLIFFAHQMIFTPALVPHKMVAITDSKFLSISRLSRISANYERDTNKLEVDFFDE